MPPRLRRTETQARTRELLVTKARVLFLRDGYHATSLEKVSEVAGFSKGAVYSNFRNKTELALAVIDAVQADEVEALVKAMSSDKTLKGRIDAFGTWAARRVGNVGWTLLEVELATHARKDHALREELAARDRAILDAFTGLLRAHEKQLGAKARLPAEVLAPALLSLGIGLGVQRTINPDVRISVLTDTVRALLSAR
jgi:AcrR family transcriptional regulator